MIVRKIFRVLAKVLSKKHIYLTTSLVYARYQKRISLQRMDFVRIASLDLAANEIYKHSITGSVAELGVYKGDFAREINMAFKDRELYLFDTFEGFDNRDIETELKNEFSHGNQDFSDTSESAVLNSMPFPEKCIIRKGFFPETAAGLETNFAFVSLDTDLFEPILAGLEYFYPRLSPGGFLFVHDFNNDNYNGAKEAVNKFCTSNSVSFTPIPDICGTAVIRKPL